MRTTRITKIFKFEAAHSVKDAYTCKCDRENNGGIHGHSYTVEMTLEGLIRQDGMVVDFTLVKEMFNHIIDAFDHSFIVNREDAVLVKLIPYLSSRYIIFHSNPTAENMAKYFFDYLEFNLSSAILPGYSCKVHSIDVWETATGKATQVKEMEVSQTPPAIAVSSTIVSKWSKQDFLIFKRSNGIDMLASPLIKSLAIDEANGIISFDVVENCK